MDAPIYVLMQTSPSPSVITHDDRQVKLTQ